MALTHWLAHLLGIDTQQSYFYDFWSGFGACFAWLGTLVTLYWRHNCHHPRCPMVGRFEHKGAHYCQRHLRASRRA